MWGKVLESRTKFRLNRLISPSAWNFTESFYDVPIRFHSPKGFSSLELQKISKIFVKIQGKVVERRVRMRLNRLISPSVWNLTESLYDVPIRIHVPKRFSGLALQKIGKIFVKIQGKVVERRVTMRLNRLVPPHVRTPYRFLACSWPDLTFSALRSSASVKGLAESQPEVPATPNSVGYLI